MRHIIITIIIALTVPLITSAASEYERASNVAAGVVASVGTSVTAELSPSKIFGSEDNYGQDFYMFIYDQVARETTDLAMKRVLANNKISQEELKLIIGGQEITELLSQPYPNAGLKPSEIVARRAKLEADIAETKDLADLEVLTKMEVEQTELFANGDESDSGFDLLVDLDIIDAILFGKTETEFGSSGPGAPAGTNVVGQGAPTAAPQGGQTQAAQTNTQSSLAPQSQPSGSAPQAISQKVPRSQQSQDGTNTTADTQVACPVNQSFNNAVLALRDKEKQSRGGERTTSDKGQTSDTKSTGKNQPDSTKSSGIGTATASLGSTSGTDSLQPPEPSGNWKRPELCGEVFCLKVEAKYKRMSSYQARDNCIACHFEKINDSFKKTLDHNLSPSKATGNLLEGSKCKRSLINLKWNIVLVPQPIVTPPNDELITNGDFLKNFNDFLKRYDPARQSRCVKKDGGKYECKQEADPVEEITARVLQTAPDGASQEDIATEIRHAVAGKQAEAAKIVEEVKLTRESSNIATQFSVLLQEMDTMNSYIDAFIKIFLQIVQGDQSNESPCQRLSKLETCS